MFFALSKILSAIFFPYPLLLWFTLYLILRLKRGKMRLAGLLFWGTIYLLSINPGSSFLISRMEDRYPYKALVETTPADGIILLCGMVNPLAPPTDRPEFLGSVDRVLAAQDLLTARKAPELIISGGSGLLSGQGESEATILSRWLIQHGVESKRIIVEANSRNTAENRDRTMELVRRYKWKSAILVTSAFHMPRSAMLFENQGIRITPFPVDYHSLRGYRGPEAFFPTPADLLHSSYAIKEFIGIIAYKLAGKIR